MNDARLGIIISITGGIQAKKMKKVLIGIAINIVVVLSWGWQDSTSKYKNINPGPPVDSYCMTFKDGRVVITTKGVIQNTDVYLRNGSLLRTNGTLLKKDGTRQNLKDGECVDQDGNVTPKGKTNG